MKYLNVLQQCVYTVKMEVLQMTPAQGKSTQYSTAELTSSWPQAAHAEGFCPILFCSALILARAKPALSTCRACTESDRKYLQTIWA